MVKVQIEKEREREREKNLPSLGCIEVDHYLRLMSNTKDLTKAEVRLELLALQAITLLRLDLPSLLIVSSFMETGPSSVILVL